MTVKEFLILSNVASNAAELLDQIGKLPKPDFVAGVRVPETLNDLTIGQLMELQSVRNVIDCIMVPCRVVLGLPIDKIEKYEAADIWGFSTWVTREVERITKLFETTSVAPTPEERRAGVDKLSFGLFGLVDYYATRMGITDHEQVECVPWVRVYKCLDMDAEKYAMNVDYGKYIRISNEYKCRKEDSFCCRKAGRSHLFVR